MTYLGKPSGINQTYLSTQNGFVESFYLTGSTTNTVALNQGNKLSSTSYNPLAAFQFNDNLLDSSGNANNLTSDSGTDLYTNSRAFNSKSFYFNNSTRVKAVTSQSFATTGSITIQGLFNFLEIPGATRTFIEFAGNGETEATNILYSLALNTTNKIVYEHESGSAATNTTLTFTSYSIVLNDWVHLAYTRDTSGMMHKLYINGVLSDQGMTATGPTTTANFTSNFYVGGAISAAEFVHFYCDSLKVHMIELTADQIANEYNSAFKTLINTYLPTTIKQTIATFNSTSALIGSPAILGATFFNPIEYRNQSIHLRSILSTNSISNTGSIKLYNVTSGAYVILSGSSDTLSMIGNNITTITSSNLYGMINFSTSSAIYRLEYYGAGSSPIVTHYNSEFVSL